MRSSAHSISNRAVRHLSIGSIRLNGWRRAAEPVPLGADEAHVWMVRADETVDVSHWIGGLEAGERERAERYAHAAGRAGYVVARSALRRLLGAYLGVPSGAVSLRRTATGKPELSGAHGGDLRFSVAHSSGVALLCFARLEVGVDVERIRPVARAGRIVTRVFSESMRRRLASVDEADWQSAFFAAWTQREALVKAVGGALMATRDPLDFHWPVTDRPRMFAEQTAQGERKWTVAKLPQPEGFAAAFVAAGDVRRLHLFELPPLQRPAGSDGG